MLQLEHGSAKFAPVTFAPRASNKPELVRSLNRAIAAINASVLESAVVTLSDSGTLSVEALVALADEQTALSLRRLTGEKLSKQEETRLAFVRSEIARNLPPPKPRDPEIVAALDDYRAWKASRSGK